MREQDRAHPHFPLSLNDSGFNEQTAKELKAALEEIEAAGAKGLIIDLRNNPGGLLSQAIEVADLFLTDGKIVTTKDRRGGERSSKAKSSETMFLPAIGETHRSPGEWPECQCQRDRRRRAARQWPGGDRRRTHIRQGKRAKPLQTLTRSENRGEAHDANLVAAQRQEHGPTRRSQGQPERVGRHAG